jgi:hypothetical protein
MRRSHLSTAAAVAVAVTVAACSSGSKSPTVPSAGSDPTTTTAPTGGSAAGGSTPLAKAQAYSQCMRSHGVPNFPDPVLTPHGDYGYRTVGINPQSAAFHDAGQACKAVAPEGWSGSSGPELSAAQQQAWLTWAKCIRSHGMSNFADPTFSGSQVHISDSGGSSSPQLESAMNACKSQMPSAGGLGG